MSVIASARNSALLLTVSLAVGCPNSGKSGNYNRNTSPTPETHEVYFPIAMGDHAVDCNTCHGEFDTFTQFSCLTGCHEMSKTDGDHAGQVGYEYTSQACYSCHPDGTAAGVDHSVFFPIASADTHGGISCSTCHQNPKDRTDITCIGPGCHENPETDSNHSGVDGYEYVSKSCYACHPDGKAEGANHDAYFPIATGATHNGTSCGTCHQDKTNRKNVSCAIDSCHPTTAAAADHGAVGGYSYDSALCLRCHADSQVNPVSTHKPFNISGGAHGGESCIICHPGFRTDKPWGADFDSLDCFASCHGKSATANHHAEVSGYQADSMSCIKSGCHPTGRAP